MARTVVVKIRDAGFRTVTRSRSMRACSNSTRTLYRMARALFESWRDQHRTTPVRLIGMGVTGLEQESSDGKAAGDRLDSSTERSLDQVLDRINQLYGDFKIFHGLALRRSKEEHQISHLGSCRFGGQHNLWLSSFDEKFCSTLQVSKKTDVHRAGFRH